jgi:hypothetical protein
MKAKWLCGAVGAAMVNVCCGGSKCSDPTDAQLCSLQQGVSTEAEVTKVLGTPRSRTQSGSAAMLEYYCDSTGEVPSLTTVFFESGRLSEITRTGPGAAGLPACVESRGDR